VSSSTPRAVVDTVILLYFLFVDKVDLLLELLGNPIATSSIVFDPDDDNVPLVARSEIGKSIDYQLRASLDITQDDDDRARAAQRADRLRQLKQLHDTGAVVLVEMTVDERRLMAQLTDKIGCRSFGLRFPLQPGEAACLAIAVGRGLVLATDDADALKALASLPVAPPYERIRKLLQRAVNDNHLTATEATSIHREMCEHGFWDKPVTF
jgi:predicted nucleic acid-binding protein